MPNIAVKKPYHVDLAELMRVYETNYAKLNALLPVGHEVGDVRCYQAVNMVYQLTVNEVTKYTTLIDICVRVFSQILLVVSFGKIIRARWLYLSGDVRA